MTLNQLLKYLKSIKDYQGGALNVNINITQLDSNLVTYKVRGNTLDVYTLRKETGQKEFHSGLE
jgi:bifunctional ADP-heptose synthase (sugar kinase/adenylyltransferase)